MKHLLQLTLITLLLVTIISSSQAQNTEKPTIDFQVELNSLNEQLEVVWASCLENSIVKLLDNNLNPIRTQVLCKETQGIIDVSDLQSDLYYVQVEHYTGVGIKPIVKTVKGTPLSVGSKTLKADLAFTIYPNPTQNEVVIESENFAPNSVVTILDIQGRLLDSSTLNSTKSIIDVSELAQGVYFIRIEDEYRVGVQQLIKK